MVSGVWATRFGAPSQLRPMAGDAFDAVGTECTASANFAVSERGNLSPNGKASLERPTCPRPPADLERDRVTRGELATTALSHGPMGVDCSTPMLAEGRAVTTSPSRSTSLSRCAPGKAKPSTDNSNCGNVLECWGAKEEMRRELRCLAKSSTRLAPAGTATRQRRCAHPSSEESPAES